MKLVVNTNLNDSDQVLHCHDLLRDLPGKRKVYDGLWRDIGVIAKIFTGRRSKYHALREWQGLTELQRRDIRAPAPLFYGQAQNGEWVAVMEKIIAAESALQHWQRSPEILRQVFDELAIHHARGVLQHDLHLENFLVSEGQLYLLDPAQISFSTALGHRCSLAQLALLLSQLPDMSDEQITLLGQCYANRRLQQWQPQDTAFVQKKSKIYRDRLNAKTIKKYLRSNSRHQLLTSKKFHAVIDREFSGDLSPREFIDHIDSYMDNGQILKRGNTCYVSRITWNGKDAVVKRYNHKGIWHSFRHTIKKSRAYHCWVRAHYLLRLYIPTPHPWAYVEKWQNGLLHKSYFISEYIPGSPLLPALQRENIQQRQQIAKRVCQLFAQLEKNLISHGDLKHQNILIADGHPFFIDLDSMQFHRWHWQYLPQRQRDMRRFFKNWRELPEIEELFREILVNYSEKE